ncbi:hypothetical protein CHARACLAT_021332 [Characodon lateralis]|uniref:Uncharacterized protein n=1 Tax=Characodon lateralis TaxID=208331 RepID=A0ABU7CQ03_9TELE|nr:hypothetical protein [Characodon lateralis]
MSQRRVLQDPDIFNRSSIKHEAVFLQEAVCQERNVLKAAPNGAETETKDQKNHNKKGFHALNVLMIPEPEFCFGSSLRLRLPLQTRSKLINLLLSITCCRLVSHSGDLRGDRTWKPGLTERVRTFKQKTGLNVEDKNHEVNV